MARKQEIAKRIQALVDSNYIDAETGHYIGSSFVEVNELFRKSILKVELDKKIKSCHACKGLNQPEHTENACGYGNLNANIFFVGQSLGAPNMATQIPFTEGSGYMLDAVLWLLNMERNDVFMSNIVHCHPRNNRASKPREVRNCLRYIIEEIFIVHPKVLVCLGASARDNVKVIIRKMQWDWINVINVKHPSAFHYTGSKFMKDWIVNLSMELEEYV